MTLHTPQSEAELERVIAALVARAEPFRIEGGGTRRGLGRLIHTTEAVSTAGLRGITLYEPSELVIAARAGTPLSDVETMLATKGQCLPFEPFDHRALYGTTGEPTIGGVFSTNASGPARISRGACRDAAIGVRVVNGYGQAVKSGGRVMKNVTGLDLTKLTCGAHGTLGVVSEVTFKVLPKAERLATLDWRGLGDAEAIRLLGTALGSPFEIVAAAHVPAGLAGPQARTLVRLETFSSSIDYRAAELARLFRHHGRPELIEGRDAERLWASVRDGALIAEPSDAVIWRVSTAPSQAAALVDSIRGTLGNLRVVYDWGGGLIWLAVPAVSDAGADVVRAAVKAAGGHATLMRAADDLRERLPVFHPLDAAMRRLTSGIKKSFDPAGLIAPGRMYAGI